MKEINILEVAKAVKGQIINGDSSVDISSVSTNSKEVRDGGLFVPIIGENIDAHNFIEDAYKHGAVACFTSRDNVFNNGIVCIKVEDTLVALQDLATYYRNQFSIPVIGITGSVGKTTSKEIVSSVLSTKYNVLKTAGNMNSQIGLALTMFRIEDYHDIAVIEMGISEEGEMDRLVRIAQPDIAIVTNIGISHIALLKTQKNIRKEKLNIINEFKEGSILFVNGNDPLLRELVDLSNNCKSKEGLQKLDKIDLSVTTYKKFKDSHVISFGTNDKNNYSAKNINTIDGKTFFTLVNLENDIEEDIILNVLGDHNINNALCAISVAKFYNIPISLAKKGLEDYKPIAMRGEIKKTDGIIIIDDTYNASPDSMKSGIDVLLSINNTNRKIAVLADVLELGSLSGKAHTDVGEFIARKKIDEVITIGKEARYIAQGVTTNNKNIVTRSFDNNEQAAQYLLETIETGDAILVKGSRGMKTEEIVNSIMSKCNKTK